MSRTRISGVTNLKDLVIELELPTVSDAASYSISTDLSSTIGEGAGVLSCGVVSFKYQYYQSSQGLTLLRVQVD